jgi:AcrR family transcriptional regulator
MPATGPGVSGRERTRDDLGVPAASVSPQRTGRPPVTSRAEILASARKLIDRDGWDKLTVRRLAAELGIGTTTLYHHIQGKEDLLLLLLNEYAGQIAQPAIPSDPRERIITAAAALHEALAAWPWAAEVLTVDGFVGLLGEPALWTVEAVVSGALDSGCTPADSVYVFRTIWYYTVGEILVRARSTRSGASVRASDQGNFLGNIDSSRLPRLASLGDQWPALAARYDYPEGLQALVDGLLAQATRGSS